MSRVSAPVTLYGRTFRSAVERLLQVLSEEKCSHNGCRTLIEHSPAVIGAIDVVRDRMQPHKRLRKAKGKR